MNLSAPENLAVVDHLLTTTRSVRKRFDFTRPVERGIIERCIEIATQAPTSSNMQNWHFVIVTDAHVRQFAHAGGHRVSHLVAVYEIVHHRARGFHALAGVGIQQHRPALVHHLPQLFQGQFGAVDV